MIFDRHHPVESRTGLILLYAEKLDPIRDHDEFDSTGILTPGLNLLPAFLLIAVAMGIRYPMQWRNRPRFSRGSLTLNQISPARQAGGSSKELRK